MPSGFLNNRGLSAKDRSEQDKREIALQGSDYKETGKPVSQSENKMWGQTLNRLNIEKDANKIYEARKGYYDELYNNEGNEDPNNDVDALYNEYTKDVSKNNEVENIKKVAFSVSPYYRKYNNPNYVSLDDNQWLELSNEYKARKDTYGEENANSFLQYTLKEHIAQNQGFFEKLWHGFAGMGTSVVSSAIQAFGNLTGGVGYLTGNGYKVEGLNGWQNFITNMIDNDVTRYAEESLKHGTFNKERIKELDEVYGGLSDRAILATEKQEDTIFNANTIPESLSNSGFTLATMLYGGALSKFINWGFKAAKGLTIAGKAGSAVRKLNQSRKVLNGLSKAENIVQGAVVPAAMGTLEGFTEALEVRVKTLEDGEKILREKQNEYILNRVEELTTEFPNISENDAINIAFKESEEDYKKSSDYIDAISARASIGDFYANSAINGVLNATIKAGLTSPSVQRALRNSKLTSWAFPSSKFNVSVNDGKYTVSPKFNWANQSLNALKEVGGEFAEESLQSISAGTVEGASEYSITKYIENKYNGDSVVDVGDYMSGTMAAGFDALGESLTSKETLKSGVYGAISSILGTPGLSRRTNKVDEDGKVVYKKNADGSLKLDSAGRPQAETVWFGRGQNSKGEKENIWEAIERVTPWRSGLYSNINQSMREKRALNEEANLLEEWLNNPETKDKLTGVIGTASWAKDMENSALNNDSFGYRNSVLGKTINDAVLLEKLKGTDTYNAYMKNIISQANVTEGTEEANRLLKEIKENPITNADFENMSDSEILERLKKNANKMLDTITTIQKETEDLERIYGNNLDDDTKISLIYGKMQLDNWNERGPKLEQEIKEVASSIEDKTENSNLSNKDKEDIALYGHSNSRKRALDNLVKIKTTLEEDIENITKRGNKQERGILRMRKAQLKDINKQISDLGNSTINDTDILSISDIMNLNPIARAVILNPENISNYSTEQQEVLDKLYKEGTLKDKDFYSKIKDSGKIYNSSKVYLEQYNSIITKPEAFNTYVAQQRQAALDVVSKEKFNSLNSYTEDDYTTFAEELDAVMRNSSNREKELIIKNLNKENNQNFQKYSKNEKDRYNIFKQILEDDEFENITDDEASSLALALQYLSNRNIDLTDKDRGVEELLSVDFINYANNIIESLDKEFKFNHSNIEELVKLYSDSVSRLKKDTSDKEDIEKPIEVKKDDTIESKPQEKIPDAKRKDETPLPKEDKPKVKEPIDNQKDESNPVDNLTDALQEPQDNENSPYNVAKRIISNLPSIKEDIRKKAIDIVENVDTDISNEDLMEYLNAAANSILINTEDNDSKDVSNLLRQVAIRLESNNSKENSELTNLFDFVNSGNIELLDIYDISKKYPDSSNAAFIKAFKIREYIESGKLTKGKPIMFVVPPTLNSKIKEEMESKHLNYDITNIPIVAVVEDKDGQFEITDEEGNKKNYQPIGLLPASTNNKNSGSARTLAIRKLAFERQSSQNKYGELITDNNGKVISTSLIRVKQKSPTHLDKGEKNNPVISVLIDNLSNDEKVTLQALNHGERVKHPVYQKLRDLFLSKLKVETGKTGRDSQKSDTHIVYETKKGNEDRKFTIFITPVQDTIDLKSGKTIAELFNSSNIFDKLSILDFNSRVRRGANELKKFCDTIFKVENDRVEIDKNGKIIPNDSTQQQISSYEDYLTSAITKFLNLPKDYKFTLEPTDNIIDESRLYRLNVSNGETTIFLGNIRSNSTEVMNYESIVGIFKNLFMDGDKVRMRNSKMSFVHWNVPYSDIANMSTNENAKNNMKDIFDDGILSVSKDRLEYEPLITISAPFDLQGNPSYFSEDNLTKSAKEGGNAVGKSAKSIIKTEGPSVIDPQTGVVLEGDTKPLPPPTPKIEKPKSEDLLDPDSLLDDVEDIRRRRKPKNKPTTQEVPPRLKWGVFEGSSIPTNEIIEYIKSGYKIESEEQWNNLSNEEKERILKCTGVF